MTQYKAAIDIGTNTAHLIIAIVDSPKTLDILYRQRHYIYLAEDGIECISDRAIERLFTALGEFYHKIKGYKGCKVIVTATEAMRRATNGHTITKRITREFNWLPQVISGRLEAQYILRGVASAVNISQGSFLTVDIGGGSVEFIHTLDGLIESIESLPIGIANLYNKYHLNEPLCESDENDLLEYLNSILHFIKPIANLNTQLIGSAGTFEVLCVKDEYNAYEKAEIVERNTLADYYDKIRWLDLGQRAKSDVIPHERARYIVMAFILVRFIVDSLNLDKFWVSHYALKEGVLLSN